jgi:hypothetical protein
VRVNGHVAPGFEPVGRLFDRLFRSPRRGGGSLVVRLRGRTVVDIWGGVADPRTGRPWRRDTLGLSFSTSKGVASTVIHRLAERGLIDYDAPVAAHWPEFAAGGKAQITVRQMLSHRAGLDHLAPIAPDVPALLDHQGAEERLAAQLFRRRFQVLRPNALAAVAIGGEVDQVAVRRPARRVIARLSVRKGNPSMLRDCFTAGKASCEEPFHALLASRIERDPPRVRRELSRIDAQRVRRQDGGALCRAHVDGRKSRIIVQPLSEHPSSIRRPLAGEAAVPAQHLAWTTMNRDNTNFLLVP